MAKKETEKEASKAVFSKKQLLASKRYKDKLDLVGALLDDNNEYTISEVDTLIKKYLESEVK